MKIYLHSDMAERSSKYVVHVAPAGDVEFLKTGDLPASWSNPDGTPRRFEVNFVFGVAEVEDSLGKYMVARGLCHPSRMMRKVRQLFDAAGNAVTELFDSQGRSVRVGD
jgi:hypothetical protein